MERHLDTPMSEGYDNNEDFTCCHRLTICHPRIRNAIVTEPISRYMGTFVTWAHIFHSVTITALVLMGWAVLYFLLGDTMLPNNDGFGLYALLIFSSWMGWTLPFIPYLNLPPVFGMLIAGLIIRNTGIYHVREDLGSATTSKIRTFCLTFIMVRTGFQLSITSLKQHPIFLLLLAFVPCTVETVVLAVCSKCILSYPWDWAFMSGTILSCMSPVVTLNCILVLAERGYSDTKGLTTILCTAACIDDVHIISIFSVCYSIVFAHGKDEKEWWWYIPTGIRDTTLGIAIGAFLGACFIFFPHRSHKHADWYRISCLIIGALACTTATAQLTISGGGYLASLVMSFVAMSGWKILSNSFDMHPFQQSTFFLWKLVQPILVGVIGADIEFADWRPSRFGLHLLCIFIGLTARIATAYLLTLRTSFTWKERLFILVCWLPKGTLQAALGPMAYEKLQQEGDHEQIEMALDLVRISVVTILFMAPIGASLITISGPYLLEKITDEQRRRNAELSYLHLISLLPTSSKTS